MSQLGVAYLAPEGFERPLEKQLNGIVGRYGRLFLTDQPLQNVHWVQNAWYEPFIVHFESISEAASTLRAIQRNWVLYSYCEHRRAALIESKLPHLSKKPLSFPTEIPQTPLGSWTLLDKHTLLASAACSSPFPHGELIFQECHHGPPSRAYLKLWEALTLAGSWPKQGDKCLEIGSSPGGWTWVLASLGANVISVDRAPLAPNVAAMPGVQHHIGNAFAMTPQQVGSCDWIFSDVACQPEKLLEWVKLWLDSALCHRFICTLKFQGDTDYSIAKEFATLPHSAVYHLSHNKHELTWICV